MYRYLLSHHSMFEADAKPPLEALRTELTKPVLNVPRFKKRNEKRTEILNWLVDQELDHYYEMMEVSTKPSGILQIGLVCINVASHAFLLRVRFNLVPIAPDFDYSNWNVVIDKRNWV